MEKYPVVINEGKAKDILEWINQGKLDLNAFAQSTRTIIVVGGDGTLFEAIQEYRHLGIPFFGINRGTLGALLGDVNSPEDLNIEICDLEKVKLRMIRVIFKKEDGELVERYAFNDVFFNVRCGSMCYGFLEGENFTKTPFEGDGIIIATSQGSTSYSRNAGGEVLPINNNVWMVQTICARKRISQKVRAQSLKLTFTRGEITAHADRQEVENVISAEIFPTDEYVTLAFSKQYDFHTKRCLIQ